jgi:hypothetical protein
MQTFFTVVVLMVSTFPSAGQKIRYVGDESTFLCKGDSIDHSFLEKLKLQGVDTIITAIYDFDNGRVEHSKHNVLWKRNGVSWLRTFNGCDVVSGDTTRKVNMDEILAYIDTAKFKGIEEPIETEVLISHNMGYFISISLPNRKIYIDVRDYQRSKIAGNEKALKDSRVTLANMLNALLK